MKKIFLSVVVVVGVLLISCGGDKKSPKGNWAYTDKESYLRSCISSAHKSYQQNGAVADSAYIHNICICSGNKLEQNYSYSDANALGGDDTRQELLKIVKDCALEAQSKMK